MWWLEFFIYIKLVFIFSMPVFLDICGSLRQLFSFTGVYYVLSYCLAVINSIEVAYY